jgi:hypothetical protein
MDQMTKAKGRGAPPRARTNPHWRKPFLAALADTSNIAAAARHAGITVSTVYKARRTEPFFARQWQAALCEGYDNLEMELLSRLRSGESIEEGAKAPSRKFDNAAAFRLLTAHRESVARQRALRDEEDEDTILASINAKLDAMRQREKETASLPLKNLAKQAA